MVKIKTSQRIYVQEGKERRGTQKKRNRFAPDDCSSVAFTQKHILIRKDHNLRKRKKKLSRSRERGHSGALCCKKKDDQRPR